MRFTILALVVALTLTPGCAGNKAPVLVGQSGLAVAQSIGVLQTGVKDLTPNPIPYPVSLRIQEDLLKVNDKLRPLPDLLRTIDKLQAANQTATPQIDQALAILELAGQDISVLITGVPVTDATTDAMKQLVALVRAAQGAVQTTLEAVAKLKGGK